MKAEVFESKPVSEFLSVDTSRPENYSARPDAGEEEAMVAYSELVIIERK
jgi:hypothetical protein